ncbi:MAG: DUF3857 and transglutaminase domain-containing protein [Candidatus Acidiferrales bacterium]
MRTKAISRRVFSLGLLLAAVGLPWARSARAGNAPDWVRAAMAEKLPDYPKAADAVVLFEDEQLTVKENGDIEEHYRSVIKLLRPEAVRQYGYDGIDFDKDTKIISMKGWTFTPSGQEIDLGDKDAFEQGVSSYEVFDDVRYKVFRYPDAAVGSVVAFEYVRKRRPRLFDDEWDFQRMIPVHRSRYSVELPAGWEFSTFWANYAEVKSHDTGENGLSWEVADVPAIEKEPYMPARPAVEGHMLVKFFPRDPAMRSKTTGSWEEIGTWYWGLIAPRRASTPEIQGKVAELTAGKTTTLEKMQALAAYSQRQIRYAAIEIGIGGNQPHAAADVLSHGYGDCKDKATLLNTMLQDIGVESYNVMIGVQRGLVQPDFPAVRFGHSITAIRLPDDVPDGGLFAEVKDPKLGRLLFFDPTNDFVPLGYLPAYDQDSYTLVVTPDGGKLVLSPTMPPATNRLMRTAKLTLSPAGDLSGEFQEYLWGWPGQEEREEFLMADPAKRAKLFESFLGNFFDNFTLTQASIGNLEQYDQDFTRTYQVRVTGYAKTAGDLLILRPRVVGEKRDGPGLFTGKERKYPVEFEEETRQDDDFEIALPAGYVVDELPDPVKVECPYGSYQSDVKVSGNTLVYKRTYQINDIQVPTEKLAEARQFFQQIAADENSSAILRRATP